jgi:hypothetical protein
MQRGAYGLLNVYLCNIFHTFLSDSRPGDIFVTVAP